MNEETIVYSQPNVCSTCKGRCCKHMGCHFSPKDFQEISLDSLKAFIEKGFVSIDCWDGDVLGRDRDNTYYLRIRNVDSDILDFSWGGRCMLLTDTGCSLSFNERPKGGRELVPQLDFRCLPLYSKKDACIEWYPYQRILEKLVSIYE